MCFYCLVAEKRRLPVTANWDITFSRKGFSNWKKVLEKFGNAVSHRKAVELTLTIPSTTKDVGEIMSVAYAEKKAENRQMLIIILSSILYLARQGLALLGRYKNEDPDDSDTNQEKWTLISYGCWWQEQKMTQVFSSGWRSLRTSSPVHRYKMKFCRSCRLLL